MVFGSLAVYFFSLFGSFFFLFLKSLFRSEPVFRNTSCIPRVTLIVPVYNEISVIREKIENCLLLDYTDLEIIFVSDGSTDGTNQVLEEYSDRIRAILCGKRKGKPAALNTGAKVATGDVIIFTDASVILRRDAVHEMVLPLLDERIGIVFGRIEYNKKQYSSLSDGEITYWNYENLLRIMQNRTGYIFSVIGGLCAMHRDSIPILPDVIADDLFLAFHAYSLGKTGYYIPEILGWEENLKSTQKEFFRKVRVIAGGWQFFLKYLPWFNHKKGFLQFMLQKPLRWCSPLLLLIHIIILISLFQINESRILLGLYSLIFILPLLEWILRLSRQAVIQTADIKIRWFFVPFYFIMINLASLLGMLRGFAGTEKIRWKTGR